MAEQKDQFGSVQEPLERLNKLLDHSINYKISPEIESPLNWKNILMAIYAEIYPLLQDNPKDLADVEEQISYVRVVCTKINQLHKLNTPEGVTQLDH